jgi:hypothetical protein
MSRSLLVRAPAEDDILEAARWYEQRSSGLGSRFLEAVDVVLAEVTNAPLRVPLVHRDVRRALLAHFPYGRDRHRLPARAPRSTQVARA